ncbi:MAG: hypothetical protein H6733_02545 [Alphaproteobacteria bacterium]|nr:hypothetical protein [Alphaproteobacteria bacterium]
MSRGALLGGLGAAVLVGCAAGDDATDGVHSDTDAVPTCAAAMAAGADLAAWDALPDLLDQVRRERFPELEGVPVALASLDSAEDFLVSDFDVTTFGAPPRERHYRVRANPRLFPDPPDGPPGFAALYAIVAHELTHVRAYTLMDDATLAAWVIDYATGPIADIERATDLHVLELGCGDGLSAYRVWLYDHVDADTRAAKERDYYTPDEIAAWQAEHAR